MLYISHRPRLAIGLPHSGPAKPRAPIVQIRRTWPAPHLAPLPGNAMGAIFLRLPHSSPPASLCLSLSPPVSFIFPGIWGVSVRLQILIAYVFSRRSCSPARSAWGWTPIVRHIGDSASESSPVRRFVPDFRLAAAAPVGSVRRSGWRRSVGDVGGFFLTSTAERL